MKEGTSGQILQLLEKMIRLLCYVKKKISKCKKGGKKKLVEISFAQEET